MNGKLYKSLIFILLIVFAGCKRDNMDDCFSNPGTNTVDDRPSAYFDDIELNDNINLVIEGGDTYSIKVEGGKNLISSVTTEITDSVLTINNSMSCNWVRNYNNELTVIVTSPALKSINYESSGDINTPTCLNITDLDLNVWGGSGSINLNIVSDKVNLRQHYGTVDFHVKGRASILTVYSNSYGPFYCEELNSDIVYIRSRGTNDCYIHANDILEAEITSVGNIYYSGNPYNLSSQVTGSGKLIKIE